MFSTARRPAGALHRCGKDFYFLIVCTWRNSNELWQTVFYKEWDAMDGFARQPREGAHNAMLCVWELAPLWHEQQAWMSDSIGGPA